VHLPKCFGRLWFQQLFNVKAGCIQGLTDSGEQAPIELHLANLIRQ
jgi:hypothetical protein